MAWRFVLTDLPGTTPLGELRNVKDRKVRHAFNGRLKTFSHTLRVDHQFADTILSADCLVKAYDDGVLRLVAELDSAQETDSGISVQWSDPFVRLSQRLIGKTAAGYTDGTPTSPKDKTQLVADVLTAVNADAYTGLDLGTVTNVGVTGFAEFAPYKPAAEAMTELVNQLDGPDLNVTPQEPQTVSAGVRLATVDVVPVLGQARPDAVFEYGTGRRNVAGYSRQINAGTFLLNTAYSPPGVSAPSGAVVTSTDTSSITAYGLREGVVQADLPDALRQKLVDEHVRLRKQPRQVITFQPTRDDADKPGRVPRYGVDFGLGDAVPFRAVQPATGSVRVNASLRVYAVDWAIDDQGAAVPTFTLTVD